MSTMDVKKIIKINNTIHEKAEKGEKEGVVKCPFCRGNITYSYYNSMAMRAKCNHCGFSMMS